MRVGDILKTKGTGVHDVRGSATLREAAQLACKHKVGALVVLGPSGSLEGIITERDILRQCAERADLDATRVEKAMTRKLVTVGPETELREAMAAMTKHHIRHLPVVEGAKLAGLVSVGDLLASALDEDETELRYLRDYISGSY